MSRARSITWGAAIRRFCRRRRGSSGTEFALVLPILALLLFGTIEGGRAMHDYQLVDKSVRHATRYLSRLDLDCSVGGAGDFTAAEKNTAKNLALTGTLSDPAGSSDYLLKYWTSKADIDITPSCIPNANFQGVYTIGEDIPHVTVTAVVPIKLQFGSWLIGNKTVSVVVRHEEVVFGD
jgi:Flp pilus assembly protein TadG